MNFSPYLFALFLLLIPIKVNALEKVYIVKGNIRNMVDNVMKNEDHVDLPSLKDISNPNIYIKFEAYPAVHYYKTEIVLLTQIDKVESFRKTLEFWGKDDIITVRTTIDIGLKRNHFPFRWINLIKDKIVGQIECDILGLEEMEIRKLAK